MRHDKRAGLGRWPTVVIVVLLAGVTCVVPTADWADLPPVFTGNVTSAWAGDYHFCTGIDPATNTCRPDGPQDPSDWHVTDDRETLTFTMLTWELQTGSTTTTTSPLGPAQ